MTSAFSFHVIYDAIDSDTKPLRTAIATLKPRVINIVGGARKAQAFSFGIDLLNKYPEMRVIFRNYPDDGLHVIDKYRLLWHRGVGGLLIIDDYRGCQRWVDDNQNYLQAGLTVLTDNESVNDDMDVYAAWQARIMDLCGEKGWRVAVGRFSVGNPRETDYARMSAMWRGLAKWHPLHTWSPNEYLPQDITNAAGMINRYQQGIDAAQSMNPPAWPFDVSIGEYGVVYRHSDGGLDALAGYRDSRIGWSGNKAFKYLYDEWMKWYKANGVDVCVYCWGGDGTPKWDRFRVDTDDGFMKALTDASLAGELEPMATKPLQPTYSIPPIVPNTRYVVHTPGAFINVRKAPIVTTTSPLATLKTGDVVIALEEMISGQEFWIHINKDDAETVTDGWISLQGGAVRLTIYTPPVIVLPPVTPAPYVEVSGEYALQIASFHRSLAVQHAAMADVWEKIAQQTAMKAA